MIETRDGHRSEWIPSEESTRDGLLTCSCGWTSAPADLLSRTEVESREISWRAHVRAAAEQPGALPNPTCANCRYSHTPDRDPADYFTPERICRRYPPQVSPMFVQFPAVADDAWCGEHAPRSLP